MNKKIKTVKPLTNWSLFLVFLKVGMLVLGGGPTILVAFKNEIVNIKQWMTEEEFDFKIPVIQSLPGPFGLNSAFMLGYFLLKSKGALLGIVCMLFPSIAIIWVFDLLINIKGLTPIFLEKFLYGVNLTASGLVFLMTISLLKRFLNKKFYVVIFLITLISISIFKLTPIIFIVMAIIVGFFMALIGSKTDDIG